MSRIYSFKEAGQDLDFTIADMVEGILEQAKGGSVRVKQSRQTDALSKLMSTFHDILKQSSKLHAAISHFPCALLERPTVIPRVLFQRPIQILFAPSVLSTVYFF